MVTGWCKISFGASQRVGILLGVTSRQDRKQITHYTKLNTFVRYPAWSPHGDQIVYEYAETTGNIWMVRMK